MKLISCCVLGGVLSVWLTAAGPAETALSPVETFDVWPEKPPGETPEGPEERVQNRPRPFYQLTNIATPTVEVYAPEPDKRTGAAWLVCPGGGLQRLAYEHEGLEVAQWATARGITAFVLKYRVPAPVQSGVADAQRALSLIRGRADAWQIDAAGIGVIGFSAGAEIAAWMATHAQERFYEAIDHVDDISCRPDYVMMIYPGGLVSRRSGGGLKEAIATHIDEGHPPAFLVHASQDASENSLHYALALRHAGNPFEMHLYHEGGHGFGMRPSGSPLGTWTDSLERWLGSLGQADSARVRGYASDVIEKLSGEEELPRFPVEGTLEEALAVQRRLVAAREEKVAGFKAAATSGAAQTELGLDGPLAGALFASGQVPMEANRFEVAWQPGMLVETEIGYRIAVDVSYQVLTAEQARDAVEALLPVIEMPRNHSSRLGLETMSAPQMVALNIGSDRFAYGEEKAPGELEAVDRLKARLTHGGEQLHEGGVESLKGGQWETLRELMNEITDQGLTIPAGTVILSGALGKPQLAEPGLYEADYGELGRVIFEVKR